MNEDKQRREGDPAKELNRVINQLYRQLGKELYDDLGKDLLRLDRYKKRARRIEKLIQTLNSLEANEEIHQGSLDAPDLLTDQPRPEKDEQGLYHYRFCPSCHAGNHPKATHCIRCGQAL